MPGPVSASRFAHDLMSPLPLAGKRIAVTRARAQSEALAQPLEALGATVLEVPTIEIRDPDSWQALDSAVAHLDEFDFLILTSVNGVQKLLERLTAAGRSASAVTHLEVGAIGPATAAELQKAGIRVDFVPGSYRAEGLLDALAGRDLSGKRFLIPRARVARDIVPRVLGERGAHVEVVEAYQTALPALDWNALRKRLTPPPDLVTFTSSSTALNFARLLEAPGERDLLRASAVRAACIGPITSETARTLGFEVVVEAAEYTVPGLIAAIREYFPVARTGSNT
jgi:uroporphyrinogen III methyltransferase/synthase